MNKDRRSTQGTGRFDIRKRVADHEAVSTGGLRKIPKCLQKHPSPRLPAVALTLVVGTIIEGIDPRTVPGQVLLHPRMKSLNIRARVVPKRHAPLVAHHKYPPSRAIQRGNRPLNARQKRNIAPLRNVFAFRGLAIDNAIAIEEDVPNILEACLHRWASEPRVIKDMR